MSETQMMTTAPPLSAQRAAIGLKTPSWKAKKLIWRHVKSPTAGIADGYRPIGKAKDAHGADVRGKAISGGWRSGKSLTAGMEGLAWLPYAQLIWLIGKDYERTRPEFTYLAEGGISTGLVSPSQIHMPLDKHQPWALRAITGCIVEAVTLADWKKSLTAKAPDVIIVCEPGLIDGLHDVVELLWGRLSEKRGALILAGTSDEANEEWYELWEGWSRENPEGGHAFSMPTWDNLHRYPGGKKEREFLVYEEKYGREALLSHYGGIPASPRDLVLRGFWKYGVHVDSTLEFNPSFPAEITIDPNYSLGNRYVVELVQWDHLSPRIWIPDEVAVEGMTHDQVRSLCEDKPWWRYISSGTIDPYAGEAHVYGAPAPMFYWEPLDLRTAHRPRVNTTVQAVKEALALDEGAPRLRVSPRAERFIYEASRWRNEKGGAPSKKNCDALKATGYWLVDHFAQERMEAREEDNVVTAGEWKYDG